MLLMIIMCSLFQSTLPTRGSDMLIFLRQHLWQVSIHAPHEGERPVTSRVRCEMMWFQSTLPTRGSDVLTFGTGAARDVSIHAPHEGERHHRPLLLLHIGQFQSTLPTRGSDRSGSRNAITHTGFNPRSPRGGATAEKCICMQHFREFTEYYPLRHGDACCIAPQDCIIQAFFGAKKRCFYVRLCFALKNKGVRG